MNLHPDNLPSPAPDRVRRTIALLSDRAPDIIQCDVPLHRLTTLQIGGPAAAVCRIDTVGQAREFQTFARRHGLPLYFLGGGSNVLAADAGFPGLILKIERDTYLVRDDHVAVGAGIVFDDLIRRTLDDELVGLEFASGIPGTLGGALVGNAGCFGHEIAEYLVTATVLRPDGTVEILQPRDFAFGYRSTGLKESGSVVLEAVLRLARGDSGAARRVREEKLSLRRARHPWNQPSAGSYFKNLPPSQPGERRRAAGELLERAGAKRMRVGGAAVFGSHANIIVNVGGATAEDVRALASKMSRAVHDRFGVVLEEEVRYLSAAAGSVPDR
jgi:UDP-N-acetylmuramate dehydrogenase